MSAVGCFGRFTFSHLAFHIPTLAGSCLCLFCVVVCLVVLFLCFWFLFCKCLGIPNSPRSLDLDDRQGLIARSAMQQKKKLSFFDPTLLFFSNYLDQTYDAPCSSDQRRYVPYQEASSA